MKKAILLLHGWLSDINDFEVLIPYLEKKYDHIERFSYSGHGDADPYEFEDQDTFEGLDNKFQWLQLNFEIIDVIGFSMGGALGVYLSQNYAFNKLVLLAPANKYFNFRFPFSKIKYLFKTLYSYEKALFTKNKEEKEFYKNRLRDILDDDKYSISFAKDKYFQRYFRHSFRMFRKIIKKINENENEVDIKNPTFIAWGKLDQLVPHSSSNDLYLRCSNDNKKFIVYDELSHVLILAKNNEKLVEDILEFLG